MVIWQQQIEQIPAKMNHEGWICSVFHKGNSWNWISPKALVAMDATGRILGLFNHQSPFFSNSQDSDITFNNLLPLYNSRLLKAYSALDDRVAKLGRLVKYWAKRRAVNEAPETLTLGSPRSEGPMCIN